MIEVDEVEVPACEDCFLDEMIESKQNLIGVEQIEDSLHEAVGEGDLSNTSGVYMTEEDQELWANYCC